jgi:hypothetical protein
LQNPLTALEFSAQEPFWFSLFFIQGVFLIRANSQTYGEANHLAAGYSYLATGDFRLNSEHPPPMKELGALPLFLIHKLPFKPDPQRWHDRADYSIGNAFLYKSTLPADRILMLSRLPNLVLGSLLVAFISWWAYRLWGSCSAFVAMALASFEPTLIARSSLVTTDLGVTLFIFLTIYLLWEYTNRPRWRLLIAIGISAGMAQIAKFSGVLLIPIVVLIFATSLISRSEPYFELPMRKKENHRKHIVHAGLLFCFIACIAALTIPPAYFFKGFSYWIDGFEKVRSHAQSGHEAFLLGEITHRGWISYFPVAFMIKTPVASLALIFASLVFYRSGKSLETRQLTFLILPAVVLFGAAVVSKFNIGIRHILPVYPFLFVLTSRLRTVQ